MADRKLWSWGDNLYGQLGLEDILDRSSPVQVGALTDWSSVAGGLYHTLAIRGQFRDYNRISFESLGWVKTRLER